MKNVLEIEITRPTQEVIFMRGVPGIGKTTEAKKIVGEGKILSTDDMITELYGDYEATFKEIKETNNSSKLAISHNEVSKRLFKFVKEGVSPIIIDNLNLHPSDMKIMVKGILKLGIDENNIIFKNMEVGKLKAKDLFERCTHDVPLEKIDKLLQRYNTFKDMSVKRILESKDKNKETEFTFTCVVLDSGSRNSLFDRFSDMIPDWWVKHGTHLTIIFGKRLKDQSLIGKRVSLTVTHIGFGEKNIALKVHGIDTFNDFPHITLAIDPDGGLAKDSNLITKFMDIKPFAVQGVVTVFDKGNIDIFNNLKK